MDIKTLNIESVLNLNDKILYGLIIESYDPNYGIKEIRKYLENKDVEILSSNKKIKTKISQVDGYRSKNNLNIFNVFIVFSDTFNKKLKVDDTVYLI